MGETGEKDALQWHNVRDLGLEGRGWEDTAGDYERFPAKAKGVVPEAVWERSRCPAGLSACFETDATAIHAKWTVEGEPSLGPQMAATGCSGLDLYATDPEGRWRWVTCFPPQDRESTASIADLAPGQRTYRLYLPLRNPLLTASIGVPEDAEFKAVPPRTEKPIVYYGTSIVHGAAASRPGTCHASLLGRRLDRPLINLGFGGNGRMEREVAELLAELDPCVYLVDCLPNMSADLVEERACPLVRILRDAHPETPIVLIEDRTYDNAWIRPAMRRRNDTSRAALRAAHQRLLDDGVTDLTYVEGEHLLGDDGDATVDSSHPTDLGFWRMADALEPVVRSLIESAFRVPRRRRVRGLGTRSPPAAGIMSPQGALA